MVDAGIYYENVIINKSINLLGEDKETTIIDGIYEEDINVNATIYIPSKLNNIKISGFTIQNGAPGISTGRSTSCNVITDNIIKDNKATVVCDGAITIELDSHNNTITNNLLCNNERFGIFLYCSRDNKIENNVVTNNDIGIYLWGGNNNISHNRVLSNYDYGIVVNKKYNNVSYNIVHNNKHGIYLEEASTNIIYKNIITRNYENGIWLDGIWSGARNCEFIGNTLQNNNVGIMVEHYCYPGNSKDNMFYCNNFLGNIVNNAEDYTKYDNEWDNGINMGNYWSDWDWGNPGYPNSGYIIPGKETGSRDYRPSNETFELNLSPEKTQMQTGPTEGKAGKKYDFSFIAEDPEDEQVQLRINWGDGNIETTDFYNSGELIEVSHTWKKDKKYTITISTADENYLEGEPLETTINIKPKGKSINQPSFKLNNMFFKLPVFTRLLKLLNKMI